jgi:hypothetical protein
MKHSCRKSLILLAAATALLVASEISQAQQLFSENFDVDHTANWTPNPGAGNNDANFFFDYSTVGIPSAPHSTGGTTRGVRLRANFQATGVFTGISVSPNGQSFSGDYKITFDFWSNFNGNAAGTGNGTTLLTGAGIGTSGTTPQHANATPTSVWFAQTGDGGNSATSKDYRAYSSATGAGTVTGYAVSSGVYAAGTGTTVGDSANAYYLPLGTNTVPAAQTAFTPTQTGTTIAGAPGFKWHTAEILKVGNAVKYSIDGLLIFTVDATGLTMDGGNIEFIQSDINATVSTDATAPTYAFGLFDNITVTNISATVTVSATTPTAAEPGASSGVFTITRAGTDVTGSLTVNYNLTGTAVNGTDYTNEFGVAIPNSVTFLPNETATNVAVKVVDDSLSELTETVVLTLGTGGGYAVGVPASDMVTIADNDAQLLQISAVSPSMYEHTPNDYATFRITRLGDLNFPSPLVIDATNIVFAGLGGTAGSNVDFVVANLPVQIDSGVVSVDVNLVKPVNDPALEGTETVVAGLTAGTDYAVSVNTASINLIDDEYVTPERILFSDSLSGDSSANWKTNFAANNGIDDQRVRWGYTLATDGVSNAPSGSLTALKLTVNKDEGSANGAAGLNLYPLSQSFSNNFAVRFNLYLTLSTGGTTEYAIFGINHSGSKTNWIIQSSTGSVTNTDSDGFWFALSADGSHSSPGDYVLYRGNGAPAPPLAVASVSAATLTNILKSPPFLFPGALDNAVGSETGTWADVEIRKVNNTVTLRINNSVIISQGNATNYSSGNIMLGYMDPYPSVGSDGAVYYSNLRVVNLTPAITSVTKSGSNLVIDFITSDLFDTATSFKVQSATGVTGPYTDDATASIALVTTGSFQATIPYAPTATALFYRIRHQ